MPRAKRSLGTVEYTQDLRAQEADPANPSAEFDDASIPTAVGSRSGNDAVSMAKEVRAAAERSGSDEQRKYIDAFDSATSSGARCVGTLIPRKVQNELDEHLTTDAAQGHHLYTVGTGDDQYFFCGLRSTYTSKRAQKLTRQCDRTNRKVVAVEKLRLGVNSNDDTNFAREPRRLCCRDVGGHAFHDEIISIVHDVNVGITYPRAPLDASIIPFPVPSELSNLLDDEDLFGHGYELG